MKPRFIEFLGAQHPVYWGMNAIHRLSTEGKYMETTGVNALMIKIAIEEGYRKQGTRKEFAIEDIFDGLDELGILNNPEKIEELAAPIYEFLPDSVVKGGTTEQTGKTQ